VEKTEIKAVEMVREIRDQIYEETKGLSREEFIAFIRRRAAAVAAEARHGPKR
jgi:hypothetical protein